MSRLGCKERRGKPYSRLIGCHLSSALNIAFRTRPTE
jgi:hypothetical protein